jgi:Phage integrase, N-terminal SAM-like domain
MACVRKRRGHWCLDYRDQQGCRHWETTKGNRKDAERLLAERVREISRGTYWRPAERVSFEGLAQAFLKDAEPNVRETTFKDYRCNLNRHLPWFSGWKARDIRRADVEAFRAHLLDEGIGPRTVNKCLTLLGALFRYAMRHEWIEANPAEGTKLRASSRRSHDLVGRPSRSKRFLRPLMRAGAWSSSPPCSPRCGKASCSGSRGAISTGRNAKSTCASSTRPRDSRA